MTVRFVTPEEITQFFESKGVPSHVASGWAQRLMYESAGGNPLAVNPTSGALGLAQDLGVRKTNLLALPNWQDPKVQLENLWNEMHGGDPISTAALPQMLAAQNKSDAYKLFTHYVERPGASGGDVLAGSGYGTGLPSRQVLSGGIPTLDSNKQFDFTSMLSPVLADGDGRISTPPILPQDSLPAGYGAGGMISILAALGAFGSKATHKCEPIDYDPWGVAHGYTTRIGSAG